MKYQNKPQPIEPKRGVLENILIGTFKYALPIYFAITLGFGTLDGLFGYVTFRNGTRELIAKDPYKNYSTFKKITFSNHLVAEQVFNFLDKNFD